MDCSTPGLPVRHQLPGFTQTHVHWVRDAIQPSHPPSFPSPLAFNLSQHQGLHVNEVAWKSNKGWFENQEKNDILSKMIIKLTKNLLVSLDYLFIARTSICYSFVRISLLIVGGLYCRASNKTGALLVENLIAWDPYFIQQTLLAVTWAHVTTKTFV